MFFGEEHRLDASINQKKVDKFRNDLKWQIEEKKRLEELKKRRDIQDSQLSGIKFNEYQDKSGWGCVCVFLWCFYFRL